MTQTPTIMKRLSVRLELNSMAIDMPRLRRHPNRHAFRGLLTFLDVPSEKAPAGARGKRVILTRAAAEAALPSLLGMGLDYTPALDGHDARRKVGVITRAEIAAAHTASGPLRPKSQAQIEVGGYLFARDFPEVVARLRTAPQLLGMSYEITDARVADITAAIWTVTEATFTGAALLLRSKAAYPQTWIRLEAQQ